MLQIKECKIFVNIELKFTTGLGAMGNLLVCFLGGDELCKLLS